MHTIQHRVIKTIAETITGRSDVTHNIKPEHRMRTDLHCDSLELIEVSQALEAEFGIRVDDEIMAALITVQHIVDYIANVCTTAPRSSAVIEDPIDAFAHKLAVLRQASLECAIELDWRKNECDLSERARDKVTVIVDNVHAAIDAIWPEEDNIEMARRLVDAGGIACCGDEPAGYGWSAI